MDALSWTTLSLSLWLSLSSSSSSLWLLCGALPCNEDSLLAQGNYMLTLRCSGFHQLATLLTVKHCSFIRMHEHDDDDNDHHHDEATTQAARPLPWPGR